MKKANLLLVAGIVLSATLHTQAQTTKGAARVGAQLGFGTNAESLGIGIRGDYAITEKILLAPDLMYFFGKSENSFDYNWFDINLNGNYLFEISDPDIIPYALAGINIAIISYDYEGIGFVEGPSDNTEIGLNIGGGADFIVGNLIVFGELRFAISSADQLVIAGGVKFPIN